MTDYPEYSTRLRDELYWILDPAGEEIYPARDEEDANKLANMMNAAYHRGKVDAIE